MKEISVTVFANRKQKYRPLGEQGLPLKEICFGQVWILYLRSRWYVVSLVEAISFQHAYRPGITTFIVSRGVRVVQHIHVQPCTRKAIWEADCRFQWPTRFFVGPIQKAITFEPWRTHALHYNPRYSRTLLFFAAVARHYVGHEKKQSSHLIL